MKNSMANIRRQSMLNAYAQHMYELHMKLSDAVEKEEYESASLIHKNINSEYRMFIGMLKSEGFYESGTTESRLYDLDKRAKNVADKVRAEMKRLDSELDLPDYQ